MQVCRRWGLKAPAARWAQGAAWLGWRRLAATTARFVAGFAANI